MTTSTEAAHTTSPTTTQKAPRAPLVITLDDEQTFRNLYDWTFDVFLNQDLFRTDHSGYWLFGCGDIIVPRENLGGVSVPGDTFVVLAYEQGDGERPSDRTIASATTIVEENLRKAANAPEGFTPDPLPAGFLILDEEAARRAYIAGVKRDGVNWYETGDAETYDCAVQMALLGEVRYG